MHIYDNLLTFFDQEGYWFQAPYYAKTVIVMLVKLLYVNRV
jgi:hypothetical protein